MRASANALGMMAHPQRASTNALWRIPSALVDERWGCADEKGMRGVERARASMESRSIGELHARMNVSVGFMLANTRPSGSLKSWHHRHPARVAMGAHSIGATA